MMKPHCDRCDVLVENSTRSWVTVQKSDSPSGKEQVYHLHLTGNNETALLCNNCVSFILIRFLIEIGISPEHRSILFNAMYPPQNLLLGIEEPDRPLQVDEPERLLSVDENTDDDIPL